MSDVKQLKDYVNSLVDEDALIKVNERQSLKKETGWLKGILKDIRKNTALPSFRYVLPGGSPKRYSGTI